jgi:MerR family transcriptional regulator/heat shock protein HspR
VDKKYWTAKEVSEIFQIEETILIELEEEKIVCPVCCEDESSKMFPVQELEKVRLAKVLMEDMGVNLEGVEVILQMRQRMIEVRRQFDAILEALAQDLKDALE